MPMRVKSEVKLFLTRNRIYERKLFMKTVFVHDNSSPERCNFSEKEMIYKVLQDHVLQDLGLIPRNLKDVIEVKNVPYKEQNI